MNTLFSQLTYQKFNIRFFSNDHNEMKFWFGSVLRNRFLYAADRVFDEQGVSLRRLIDTLSIPEEHGLFGQLQGGFPKGFLFDSSNIPYNAPGFTLEANKVYTISLILIGNTINRKQLFLEAIQLMLQEGFGHPIAPMTLIDITEEPTQSFTTDFHESTERVKLELLLKTPVCLFHASKEDGNGFQNKLNSFPSFYQFMRSLTYRMLTLCTLYADSSMLSSKEEMDNLTEQYLQPSVQALLLRADLRLEKRYNTPKKGENSVHTMSGYTGRLVFGQVSAQYLPLLTFAEALGVGANIHYGLGSYQIRHQ